METVAKKNSLYIGLALLIGFLYRMLLSLQGIDHADMGFSNTFYQNIFSHPEAVTLHFNYYVTGLVGGLWYLLLGSTGLLGFRLLEAILLTASIYFVYRTFHRQLHTTRAAVIAILLSSLFPYLDTTFYFNTLTFFFMSLAAWCYSQSLYGRQLPWTFLSGLVLGLAFFVRIANFSLMLLLLVPIVYALATHQKSLALKLGSAMLGGMLTGCAVVLGIMMTLGHLGYFLEGLHENIACVEDGIWLLGGSLAVSYCRDMVNIILQILAIIGLGALYLQSSRITSRWADALRMFLIVASLVLIATSLPYLSSISLYTLLCAPIFYSITPKEDKLLAAFVLLATYLYPIGNDSGIVNIYHWTAALLIIPAVVGTYHTSRILRKGVFIYSLYIAVVMLWRAFTYPFGEQEPRYLCTAKVEHSVLNTYTTPEKVDAYQHILSTLDKYLPQQSWLVMGSQASEIYYASGKLPLLGTTKMKTYQGERLLARLRQQTAKYGQQPAILFLKSEHFNSEETAEVQSVLSAWMKDRNYQVVVDNEYLTLYQ